MQVLKEEGIHYICHSTSDKEIAMVSVVWQVIGALNMTSNIETPIIHKKLHDMYEDITSAMYGSHIERV